MEDNKIEEVGKSLLNRLLSDGTKESSKRFLAVYVVIVLGTLITAVALWNKVDYIYLLGAWLAFAASLLGLSEYNKNRQAKHNATVEIEKVKSVSVSNKKISDENNID